MFRAAGLAPEDVVVIRHTLSRDGLRTTAEAAGPRLLPYTRSQAIRNSKLPAVPPRIWLNFLATTGRRARFITAFENHGEAPAERTDSLRFFDLRPSPVMAALADRLVIEWSKDAVNWAKAGTLAAAFPVVEVADPSSVPFPGFDSLLVSYDELLAVITDDRYVQWRTALSSVQGIYFIADTSTAGCTWARPTAPNGFLAAGASTPGTATAGTSPSAS